jgi:hypothetical protein|tara:strand:- start:5037 stop:5150 length:114 start_codon:yes stop_codon:yes gene_type:complete
MQDVLTKKEITDEYFNNPKSEKVNLFVRGRISRKLFL